jgi:hypothetical protein
MFLNMTLHSLLKFIRVVGVLGFVLGVFCSYCGSCLLGFLLVLFLGVSLGVFCWAVGWVPWVYFEALRAFIVYLEVHCAF